MASLLPEDIINFSILTRLPLKSLARFSCVCKSWSTLFTKPNFVKLQLNHNPGILIDRNDTSICYVDYDLASETVSSEVTKIDYPVEYKKYEILGVSNGLICYRTENEGIIIWNPYTKDYMKLPDPPESTGLNTNHCGFGYDVGTDDYKFARIANCLSRYSELNVYSLRTNSWKTMANIPFLYPIDKLVLFNGIFHWVEIPTINSGLPRVIGSFDLERETFKEIHLPQELLVMFKFPVVYLRLLDSCLYLIGNIYMGGAEVWTMKEYGVKESWTKMFTIDCEKFGGAPFLDVKNSIGNSVIDVEVDQAYPYIYDLRKEEARKLEIDGIPAPFVTWAFLGSLVSPTFGTSLAAQ